MKFVKNNKELGDSNAEPQSNAEKTSSYFFFSAYSAALRLCEKKTIWPARPARGQARGRGPRGAGRGR